MAEIVQIHVGQCGIQIGENFWQKLIDEHKIDKNGYFYGKENETFLLDNANVHLEHDSKNRYTPRTVLIDLESNVLENIQQSELTSILKKEDMIYSNSGSGSIYGIGHYIEGPKLRDKYMECIRKKIEKCDKFYACNLIFSLAGGTGSGLGTRIVDYLREEYSNIKINTFNVIPNEKTKSNSYQVYNSVLSIHNMLDYTDFNLFYDNNALSKVCLNRMHIKSPNLFDMNNLISRTLLGITACDRFSSQIKVGLAKLQYNLNYGSRFHIYVPNITIQSKELNDFNQELYQLKDNSLLSINQLEGKIISFASLIRNKDLSMHGVSQLLNNFHSKNSIFFPLKPHTITGVCNVSETISNISCTTINNTTSIIKPLSQLNENFLKLFKRRAFVNYYIQDAGMEECEFTEADEDIFYLVDDYRKFGEMLENKETEEENEDY